jgi:hypothetical protein
MLSNEWPVNAFYLGVRRGRVALQRVAFALSLVLGLTLPTLPSHAFDGPHLDSASQDRQLSQADIERYQTIFAVQADGAWTEADELIARLENDILLGI